MRRTALVISLPKIFMHKTSSALINRTVHPCALPAISLPPFLHLLTNPLAAVRRHSATRTQPQHRPSSPSTVTIPQSSTSGTAIPTSAQPSPAASRSQSRHHDVPKRIAHEQHRDRHIGGCHRHHRLCRHRPNWPHGDINPNHHCRISDLFPIEPMTGAPSEPKPTTPACPCIERLLVVVHQIELVEEDAVSFRRIA